MPESTQSSAEGVSVSSVESTSEGQQPSDTRPTSSEIRRWRRYLANERAEADLYYRLARKRKGEAREILLTIAAAEKRHEEHWIKLLGSEVGSPRRPDLSTRLLTLLATFFSSVLVLAIIQRAETHTPYQNEPAASDAMRADEAIHAEIVRSLAEEGRTKLSGGLRAAVFGANDGLVSNLALVLAVAGGGAGQTMILLTGLAGLLSGALSMGAGEFISVRSQQEFVAASNPDPDASKTIKHLNIDANELALVYRARGLDASTAEGKAKADLMSFNLNVLSESELFDSSSQSEVSQTIGGAVTAAVSSFFSFASGAIVSVLPYIFGLTGSTAMILAVGLVGLALITTGGLVGTLSGVSPATRAFRQLAIGYGAAGATYLLGLIFGATVG